MNKRLFLICAVAWPTLAPAMSNPNFTPCTLTGTTPGVSVEAECSRWVVPENREQPDGRTIELLFARVPAVSKSPRPDPVVLLAGGPGQSATETYPQLAGAFARLNRTRDIWLIDQRGTGGSNPLDCPYPKETMFATPDPALISGIARDCRERLEREGNDLARYTTTDYIADLEQLREAMGVAELNLYGGSYGTRVGLEYLRRHPSAIRSAVLDGVVPPDLGLGQDHASNLDATLAQADLTNIGHEAELAVAKKLAEWPRLVEIAAKGHEPHRIAFYLYDLASEFHGLWNKGNDDLSLRFLQDGDNATTQAKIALIRSVSVVIAAGLGILGVTPAEEIR